MIDRIDTIIMLLCKGMSNRKLYFSDHPRVDSYARDVVQHVDDYLRSTGSSELFIGIVDNFFVFEGKRIFGASVTGKQLMEFARSLQCGGFGFEAGLRSTELKKFFDVSSLKAKPVKSAAEARRFFQRYGIGHIRPGEKYAKTSEPPVLGRSVWEGRSAGTGGQNPALVFQELYDAVGSAYGLAGQDKNIDLGLTRSVSEFLLRYVQESFADVMQSVNYPDYDSYTVGHSVRVASLAVYIGSKLRWPEKDLLEIGCAALLHDIGKCRIPDAILLKKGPLTDEEFDLVRLHPQAGAEILMEQPGITGLALGACWGHHLRHDGGGYPQMAGWAVSSPVTSLLHICDVFEALTAVRPYKAVMEPHDAYGVMMADRGGFHPGMLALFISLVGLYPPGTYVRLSDRAVGVVQESGKNIDRPLIRILSTGQGTPLSEADQYLLDLADDRVKTIQVEQLLLDYMV